MQSWSTIFRRTLAWSLGLILSMGTLFGCIESPTHESYGLPLVFSIYIDEDDLSAMRTGLHAKPKVPASAWINSELYKAKVLHSGATSIKNLRRSYELHLEEPFEGMKVFRLNAMVGDYSTMRATMAYHAYDLVGFEMPRYEPVALWVNDEYYGVYNLQQLMTEPDYWKESSPEGITPVYMYQAKKSLMGTGADIYENLEQKFSVKYGTKEFVGLEEFIRRLAKEPSDEGRDRIEQMADVDQILLYMAMVQYLHHGDGVTNNFYFVSTHLHPRFRIFPWDLDVTFKKAGTPENGDIFTISHMMNRFYNDDPPYRAMFENHVQYIHSKLTLDAMLSHLDGYYWLIKDAWEADDYRNAQGITLDQYREEIANRIKSNRENYQQYLERQ
ncbi:MAG: CotH kinase family protein [Myxococcota bacterium]|nr:CotH kinase family protein [Myxococcota bacterium]